MDARIGDEKFFIRTLEDLMKNEQSIKQYFGKRVLITAVNRRDKFRERGEFHCCESNGWISFEQVECDINPKTQFLEGIHSSSWISSIIDDIQLIQYEPDDYKYNQDQKDDDLILGKSIKNELWDEARNKLIQYALFKLIPLYPEFEPFDIKYRKQYLKKSTKYSIKREIGDKILKLRIPQSLSENPRFHQLFQNAIFDEETIRNNSSCYDLPNALSLLNDYHKLWIQHIKDITELEEEKELDSVNNNNTLRTNYSDWDDWELNVPQYNLMNIGCIGIEMWEPPIYSKQTLPMIPMTMHPMTTKAKCIRIDSIFPFNFIGPCFKLKKNNPDWRCIECNQESKMDDERIYFYKSKRTDMTVEICVTCVNNCIAIKSQKYLQRKALKFNKRKHKRTKKILDEYNRKGLPYTPPIIQYGLTFNGIH